MYLLKNLFIFDRFFSINHRVLGEMYFMEEIAIQELPVINSYVERSSKFINLKTDEIVRRYWKLIKESAKLLASKKHILCYPRSQRR